MNTKIITPVSILIPYRLKNGLYELWVQERTSGDGLNGLLEFPGGKIEVDESPVGACAREVMEETSVLIEIDKLRLLESRFFETDKKNLQIFIFVYNDLEGKFEDSGYFDGETLFTNVERILPNNQVIIGSCMSYLKNFNLA